MKTTTVRLDLGKYEGMFPAPYQIEKVNTIDGPLASVFYKNEGGYSERVASFCPDDLMIYAQDGPPPVMAIAVRDLPDIISALRLAYAREDAQDERIDKLGEITKKTLGTMDMLIDKSTHRDKLLSEQEQQIGELVKVGGMMVEDHEKWATGIGGMTSSKMMRDLIAKHKEN